MCHSPAIRFKVIVVSAQNCRTRAALSGSTLRRFTSSAADLSRQSLRGGGSLHHYVLRLRTAALRGKCGFIHAIRAIRGPTHISAFPHQIVVKRTYYSPKIRLWASFLFISCLSQATCKYFKKICTLDSGCPGYPAIIVPDEHGSASILRLPAPHPGGHPPCPNARQGSLDSASLIASSGKPQPCPPGNRPKTVTFYTTNI